MPPRRPSGGARRRPRGCPFSAPPVIVRRPAALRASVGGLPAVDPNRPVPLPMPAGFTPGANRRRRSMRCSPWILALCLSLFLAALPTVALAQAAQAAQATEDSLPKSDAIAAIAPRPLATCPTFQAIACGQTIDGSLAPSDCTLPDGTAVDYYRFAGTIGESITGTLTTSAFPPFLELLDPNQGIKTSNSSGAPGTVQLPFTLDPRLDGELEPGGHQQRHHAAVRRLHHQPGLRRHRSHLQTERHHPLRRQWPLLGAGQLRRRRRQRRPGARGRPHQRHRLSLVLQRLQRRGGGQGAERLRPEQQVLGLRR